MRIENKTATENEKNEKEENFLCVSYSQFNFQSGLGEHNLYFMLCSAFKMSNVKSEQFFNSRRKQKNGKKEIIIKRIRVCLIACCDCRKYIQANVVYVVCVCVNVNNCAVVSFVLSPRTNING